MGFCALFEGCVDVIGRDWLPSHVQRVGVRVDGHGLVVIASGHYVVDTSGEGLDGAVDGFGAFNMHILAFGAVLLVGYADSGIDGPVQLFQSELMTWGWHDC